jgi:hypothetical protein
MGMVTMVVSLIYLSIFLFKFRHVGVDLHIPWLQFSSNSKVSAFIVYKHRHGGFDSNFTTY